MDKKVLTASYDGYSACPIPTQYGKLMLAEFDYTNKLYSQDLIKWKIIEWGITNKFHYYK